MQHETDSSQQTVRLTQVKLEELRVRRATSPARGVPPEKGSRRPKVQLEEHRDDLAALSVVEQIRTRCGIHLTVRSRAEFSVGADVSQSELEQRLPALAEHAAPFSSEIVAYLTRRMGFAPEIMPPTYAADDAPGTADSAVPSSFCQQQVTLGARQIRPVFASDEFLPADFQVTSLRLTRLSAQRPADHDAGGNAEQEVEISWTPSLVRQEGQEATVELAVSLGVGDQARIDVNYQIQVHLAPDIQPEMLQLPANLELIARCAGPFVSQTVASLTADLGVPPLVLPGLV